MLKGILWRVISGLSQELVITLLDANTLLVGLDLRGNSFICPASKVTEPLPLPGVMLTCTQMYPAKGGMLDHY